MPKIKKTLRFDPYGGYEHVPSEESFTPHDTAAPRKAKAAPAAPEKVSTLTAPLNPGHKSGGFVEYGVLDAATASAYISESTHKAVFQAVGWARRELRLPPIDVKYFVDLREAVHDPGLQSAVYAKLFDHNGGLLGVIDAGKGVNRIYINGSSRVSDPARQKAALHECVHLSQANSGHLSYTLDTLENSAHTFGHEGALKLWSLPEKELQDLMFLGMEME